MLVSSRVASLTCVALMIAGSGCATVPAPEDRSTFLADAKSTKDWFVSRVPGLDRQLRNSAGYVVFPNVGQWGIVFSGGKFGRGVVHRPDGSKDGWAAINATSLGLQAGAQGFRAMLVFEDAATFEKFKRDQLSGSVTATAVAGVGGVGGTAPFSNGVAIYESANAGLMAGANVGLNYLRYRPFDDASGGK